MTEDQGAGGDRYRASGDVGVQCGPGADLVGLGADSVGTRSGSIQ